MAVNWSALHEQRRSKSDPVPAESPPRGNNRRLVRPDDGGDGRPVTRESLQRQRMLEAVEYERRRFQKYVESRDRRVEQYRAKYDGVARYLDALARIESTVVVHYNDDVDYDLAMLAIRCRLDTIPDDIARSTILGLTRDWIDKCRKAQRAENISKDDAECTWLEGTPDSGTTMSDLRIALRLR